MNCFCRALLFLAALATLGFVSASATAKTPATWLELSVGSIGVASQEALETALKTAQTTGDDGLLIVLDTPGGSLEATRHMVEALMSSPLPVVVWVGPSGARAGSAGAFLVLAANVASMAPGTNIGASHPVGGQGQDLPAGEMGRKITNDALAFISSIAAQRGRDVEMARSFVEASASITNDEALEHHVIDLIATSPESLMHAIDGRRVSVTGGRSLVLATKEAQLVPAPSSFRLKLLEVLSNPNLFYLLFVAGIIGLGFELTHPGVFFPGIAGAICMLLALISMSVLPVSWGAVALIIVGLGLIIAEMFMPTVGILGIGGFVAFLLGSVFLVDPSNKEGLRVSLFAVLPGATAVGLAAAAIFYLVFRAGRAPVETGREGMMGQIGEALATFKDGQGSVRIMGEIWQARQAIEEPPQPTLQEGEAIKVLSVDGLLLTVNRVSYSPIQINNVII